MSDVQTGAERTPLDLTHFVYSTGAIGCLKTLSTINVVAGDSISIDAVGAFRLAPLRRGLSVDSKVEVFTFYVPYRHSYGQAWVDAMKAGMPASGTPAILATDDIAAQGGEIQDGEICSFLGTHVNLNSRKVPKYLYQSYLNIFNHYFKKPFQPDFTNSLASLDAWILRDGFATHNLESFWTMPLNPSVQTSQKFNDMAGNDGIDIMALNTAYGKLHTQQERENFMQRYRDVVSSFGGSTHYDADVRPHLLMRTKLWASGYDTDGTTQDTLGQFSGRVQQPFSHRVPRFYVPEHGVIMTLIVCRFPPTHEYEMHYLVGKGGLDYQDLACDPSLVGNSPPVNYPIQYYFSTAVTGASGLYPHSQYYRYQPSHVDARYRTLQGFPFFNHISTGQEDNVQSVPTTFDRIFQTTQLGHWNVQSKFNVSVMRHMPVARDSIMTS